ncbi:hypothetical protein [Metabacillus litoralis]|uniref:hypothetical protein n=1 Tax=Metabacillus litoralis TaxID=152268 RepID=UPI00203F8CF1|nr:hypothetical protein [Metabacillus litoralis]MCM3409637.1 hypothetical protein [Metabacillus litoralis]
MAKRADEEYKSKIETDDAWNRAFYGNPTKGGCLVMILVIIFILWLINNPS